MSSSNARMIERPRWFKFEMVWDVGNGSRCQLISWQGYSLERMNNLHFRAVCLGLMLAWVRCEGEARGSLAEACVHLGSGSTRREPGIRSTVGSRDSMGRMDANDTHHRGWKRWPWGLPLFKGDVSACLPPAFSIPRRQQQRPGATSHFGPKARGGQSRDTRLGRGRDTRSAGLIGRHTSRSPPSPLPASLPPPLCAPPIRWFGPTEACALLSQPEQTTLIVVSRWFGG